MREIILIAPENFSLVEVAMPFIENNEFQVIAENDRVYIEEITEKNFVQFERSDCLANYYDDEEGEIFRSSIRNPQFFLINFKNIIFLKFIVSTTLDRMDIFVDNDFGLIVSGSAFVKLIKRQPYWDWALDSKQ